MNIPTESLNALAAFDSTAPPCKWYVISRHIPNTAVSHDSAWLIAAESDHVADDAVRAYQAFEDRDTPECYDAPEITRHSVGMPDRETAWQELIRAFPWLA